jgi:hypothetical protein
MQVAYYSLLLEHLIEDEDLGAEIDDVYGVIWSREGRETFEIGPYRRAVQDFLRDDAGDIMGSHPQEAHYHVCQTCMLCEWVEVCQEEADRTEDLSRIPYITSESKRRLNEAGIENCAELADLAEERPVDRIENLKERSHDLSVNLDRYLNSALALQDGEYRLQNDSTLAMPSYQDVRIVLTAEKDAVTDTVFAIGMRVFRWENGPVSTEEIFIADQHDSEADLLLDFLQTLNPLLQQIDHENRIRQQNLTDGQEAWRELDALHFFAYDTLDLSALRGALERQIFNDDRPELRREIRDLVRLFPPDNVLPDAETFRTIPGTVVTHVLKQLVSLPTAYTYDLRDVSQLFQVRNSDGEEVGWEFRPFRPFCWEHSNQIAFERIHNVWNQQSFEYGGERFEPDEILERIDQTIRSKLRATESVVRRMQDELRDQLRLFKEPFRLHRQFDPVEFDMIEALETFTLLETSLDELQIKHLHTLPVEERVSKFECIRGLEYDEPGPNNSHWFTFDPVCRDAKFDEGDFALIVTHEENPGELLGIDERSLFERTGFWRYLPYQVTLEEYDLDSDPPRVCILPRDQNRFRDAIDFGETLVLDKIHVDFNTQKIFDTLGDLSDMPEQAQHIQDLMENGTIQGWTPFIDGVEELERELIGRARIDGLEQAQILNDEQWEAWRGVFQEPLSLIWGPPGTGKTRTLAHILLGYALAAHHQGEPFRILVSAFTHNAVVNVLNKARELADHYGIEARELRLMKMRGYGEHPADARLDDSVELVSAQEAFYYTREADVCTVVGGTVWGAYKSVQRTVGNAVHPFFDAVVIDEASQMRLPDALVALGTSRPEANIILAGDDKQLPPIIHGEYPEEHEPILSSVFSFVRHRIEQRGEDVRERTLFQLVQNYRMNEPLTAYPRDVLYGGNFETNQPTIRTQMTGDNAEADPAIVAMADPERPVILCRYTPPRSYTSSNPIESQLVAALTDYLSATLIDSRSDDNALFDADSFASRGIAALAPHRAQNSAIRQALRERGFGTDERPMPLVDTVDKLQGQERDVVLVSYGVADGEYAETEADFLLSSNRFNVATTRAQRKVVVFCSEPVLNVIPTDRDVLIDSMMLKEFRDYCDSGSVSRLWHAEDGAQVTLNIHWKEFDV